ncbi:hypothetical protein ENUP19_0181G0048 [Entamoeba nuttalli]|uniref:Uncharacterized protein n=1 Tax=Entamoeba nuttalli TaxID=412467 RepID=A0ABQ0DN48_9EUKA
MKNEKSCDSNVTNAEEEIKRQLNEFEQVLLQSLKAQFSPLFVPSNTDTMNVSISKMYL